MTWETLLLGLGLLEKFVESGADWVNLEDEVPPEKLAILAAKTDASVDRAHRLRGDGS